MMPHRRVLLCGKSLLISGLLATLVETPELDLQLIEPQTDPLRERIREWQPEILILENELLTCQAYLSLLIEFPQMKLIGLDIEDNRLFVFSGQSSYAPTTIDLLQAIGT
jgi:hypothetical protein